MKWTYLENRNGIEIQEDIRTLNEEDYKELRQLLFEHLIVVFRKQEPSSYEFGRMCHHIGYKGIGNWHHLNWYSDGEERYPGLEGVPRGKKLMNEGYQDPADYVDCKEKFPVQRVTGSKNKTGVPTGIFGGAKLTWHSNINGWSSNDGVGLQGWDNSQNTCTEFLNTARCRKTIDPQLLEVLDKTWFQWQENLDNWSEGLEINKSKTGANRSAVQNSGWVGIYKLWFLQQNRADVKGFYFHFLNDYTVHSPDPNIVEIIKDFAFKDEYKYVHWWEPGDIVLMDQLVTLHQRGKLTQETNNKRVLHRFEFALSNYDNYLRAQNVIIPGRNVGKY